MKFLKSILLMINTNEISNIFEYISPFNQLYAFYHIALII